MSASENIARLGLIIPGLSGPFGAYVPAKRVGNLVYTAGQLPMKDGKLIAIGQVPGRCPLETARAGARQSVINALAALQSVVGNIDSIVGIVRVGVFVSSEVGFIEQ